MKAAAWPRPATALHRLLHVDPQRGTFIDRRLQELADLLRPQDVLVFNDAATLPASLAGTTRDGPVEIRLTGPGPDWQAVVFGAGTWRMRTEDRPQPPRLEVGEQIEFAAGLRGSVTEVSNVSPRLVTLRFNRQGDDLWAALYRAGKPVQYSHLCGTLNLWQVQTVYAARPWAVEMPSAGYALTTALIHALRRRGVQLATLTHAAGLSSTGDAALDALLPLPERYEIPAATVEAVERAHERGGRVVAVGTTVVRALEGCARSNGGALKPGPGRTDLRLSAGQPLQVVSGILTGLHEPGTSHFDLLQAFAPAAGLNAALAHAEAAGYLAHEFGDLALILRD